MEFITAVDRLKGVLRRTSLIDGSRRENAAEHSWHVALMAAVLAEHAKVPVDVPRVVQMLLVHDLVEIDAGDTFCYDRAGMADKAARERAAAERLFGLLPPDQRDMVRALWDEFEAMETPEALFANALDRLQPVLNNFVSGGGTWREYGITLDQVRERIKPIAAASSALGAYVEALVSEAVRCGMIRQDNGPEQEDASTHEEMLPTPGIDTAEKPC